MNATQRASYGAASRMVATDVFGEAIRQNDRAVNSANHFQYRDGARFAGQAVAAIGAVLGLQKARFPKLLQQFREQRKRNPAAIGHFFGADGIIRLSLPGGKMLESNQTVVRLFS